LILTRPFDKHLDSEEMDAFLSLQRASVSDLGQISEQSLREAQRHVESCLECSEKLQMHQFVQREISRMRAPDSSPPTPECKGDAEWLEVAAGLRPAAETRERMKHAAQCGHCGPLLKNAAEALVDEATHSEEAWLDSLPSARSEWRKNMADKLRGNAAGSGSPLVKDGREEKQDPKWWRDLFSWTRPALAFAGVAAVIVVGWIGAWFLRPPSAEQLLAQAYTEHRTLEVRLPGAKYAPMRVERGASNSNLDKSPALLRAEALIGEKLLQHPNDPAWLQARARADLLDGNYDSAIKSLQRALETVPDSPSLLTDLGSAYFLRAESADRPIDYGNAIESLGKALVKSPDDPIALFNRALACERMFFYTQAVDDWEHYLRLDPVGEWSDEAHRRLSTLKEKIRQHDQSQAEPLLSPAEIAGANIQDPALRKKIDSQIEKYLRAAVTEWVPAAYQLHSGPSASEAQTSLALQTVAEIASQTHRDPWLSDLLSVALSKDFQQATKTLSEAIRDNEKADTQQAYARARESEILFERANNQAGALRARLELLAASNIDQDGARCLRAASGKDFLKRSSYHWLRAQWEIESGSCAWLNEDLGVARRHYASASEAALSGDFRSVYLRSRDHLAGLQGASGDFKSAWETAWHGLAAYWSGNYEDVRAYNFYYDIYELSRMTALPHTQVASWRDGLRLSESSPDIAQRAMARLAMANAAESAGLLQLSGVEFARASELFAVSPQNDSTRIARLEAETRLAGVEKMRGNAVRAIGRLKGLQTEMARASDNFLAILFYTNLGEAEAAQADWGGAERDLSRAISLGERQLRTLSDDKSRMEVVRQSAGAYRALVRRRLLMDDSEGALALWERYLASSLRTGDSTASNFEFSESTQHDKARLDVRLSSLVKETLVSYALLPDGLAIWVADDHGVSAHWMESSTQDIVAMAAHFRSLCADPHSDPTEFRAESRALYELFISPVKDRLSPGRTLLTELDGELDGLPLEALLDKQGHYLGERGPVVASLGLYYWPELRTPIAIHEDSAALIAAVPSSEAEVGAQPLLPLPEVILEGEAVAGNFHHGTLLEAKDATRDSVLSLLSGKVLFHFAGHAINNSRQSGILLSDGLLTPESVNRDSLSQMQLAVFSGCDTQDGPSGTFNEAEGLVRVFLLADVPSVVASRWNVDSLATRQFMDLFYKALLRGESVAVSLREAQTILRAQPRTSHPYYWSAFAAFGVS
jgi:CHAT domain-containing protein